MDEPPTNIPGAETTTRKLIYVVDDEPMLLELATTILAPLGYRLQTFRDPKLALQAYAAAQRPPDLLITDYAMHEMNGLDLLEGCRRLHPHQTVLLVSGTVDESVYLQSALKPDRFLAKPYPARHLVEAVHTLLGD